MAGLVERLRTWFLGPRPATEPAPIYTDLRSMVLDLEPDAIDVLEGEPWSAALVAVLELGLVAGSATIVAVADGSVSMYTSSGGGVLGAGDHVAVRAAATRFRVATGEHRPHFRAVETYPPPSPEGQVAFLARFADARLAAAAPETLLRSGRHPLAGLYAVGQDLLTEIRLASD
jgi:hypothetical protein